MRRALDPLCVMCHIPQSGGGANLDGRLFCFDCLKRISQVAEQQVSGSVGSHAQATRALLMIAKATSSTAPENPSPGQLWFNPENDKLYLCQRRDNLDGYAYAYWLEAGKIKLPESEPPVDPLTMWVIYKNPSGFANRQKGDVYVLRRWRVGPNFSEPDEKVTYFGSDLAKVRAKVPAGLVCMERSDSDDPTILETWF